MVSLINAHEMPIFAVTQQSVSSVPPSATVTDKRIGIKIALLSALKSVPRVGSILWVDSAKLRWTHDKIQRLFTYGLRLEDAVTNLPRGILLPSDLRMISIVHWKSKGCSRNNRRLWYFREAAVIAVKGHVCSTDRVFLHGG